MRKKILFIVCFCAFAVTPMFAQSVKENPTATTRLNFVVDEDLYSFLHLSQTSGLALVTQGDNPEVKEFLHNTYAHIEKALKDAGVQLEDIGALSGKVKYSKAGFPIVSTAKAAKTKSFDQYMTVMVDLQADKKSTSTSSIGGFGKTKVKCFPEMNITIVIAGADGKKIKKVVGKYRMENKVEVSSESFTIEDLGLTFGQEVDHNGDLPYYQMIDKAMANLVSQL